MKFKNNYYIDFNEIPNLSFNEFKYKLTSEIKTFSARAKALFFIPPSKLCALIVYDKENLMSIFSTEISKKFNSLTEEINSLHYFEREIFEDYEILPENHPWLKKVRFHSNSNEIGNIDFFKITGKDIHEVGVGPVHAGIIEPGHFRFNCHGEIVLNLEIALGYQHRGIEQKLLGKLNSKNKHYIETCAGDSTISYVNGYTNAIETLLEIKTSLRNQDLRVLVEELERCANHVGDLGALAGDVAYLPTASFCGRLRGDFLNASALITGSRFGRNFIEIGHLNFTLNSKLIHELKEKINSAYKDVQNAIEILFTTDSVITRFENIGTLHYEDAKKLGIVGMPARASGVDIDTRKYHPYLSHKTRLIKIAKEQTGDVLARAKVRWIEIQESVKLMLQILEHLPEENIETKIKKILPPEKLVVSMTEGFRGEICQIIATNKHNEIGFYKIIDPSFHNWQALAFAMRNQQISDFPVCNKSFNLSYCGHDL